MAGSDYFAVPIFFIVFRECLEASIIVSVLLAFINQSTISLPTGNATRETNEFLRKKLVRQVWWGAGIGLLICFCIGGGFIGAFYALQNNLWGKSEELWEGIFSLVATVLITVMGLAMLRINKLKQKWTSKLAASFHEKTDYAELAKPKGIWTKFQDWSRKYAMFILPFITVLREGLEAVVFVGGVGLSTPAKAFPIPVIMGLFAGFLVGFFIYKGNRYLSIEYFLIASTWILYLVAAGLFSKAIGYFETYRWNLYTGGDAAENGAGPGSYNIKWTIWHVNYGNPEIKDSGYGWQIFNAVFGWNNTGTYGTTLGYIFYWLAVTAALIYMRFKESRQQRTTREIMNRKDSSSLSSMKQSPVLTSKTDKAIEPTVREAHEIEHMID